ncbi:conserved hypothetical protein [Alteracholeplasma palmae J233]|uniref:Uncharacterized protein n=1 Tax=Alteracholeplasma palmae (strain ATCC 49389 / J233) TaxID=1318466 RepID=U4KL51_ALTPJ|nr:hypothetical protein [Alteracholeplasma palmae]CCV64609.1 conserved hypothetical protein [Alteracholeplasma palmae J233]
MAYKIFKKKFDYRLRIIAATPMISILLFLILGFFFNLWHPGWIVFLLVPAMPFILGLKKITASYSLLCLIIYIVLGVVFNLWHPGWIIFLLVPILNILIPNSKVSRDSRTERIIIDQDEDN